MNEWPGVGHDDVSSHAIISDYGNPYKTPGISTHKVPVQHYWAIVWLDFSRVAYAPPCHHTPSQYTEYTLQTWCVKLGWPWIMSLSMPLFSISAPPLSTAVCIYLQKPSSLSTAVCIYLQKSSSLSSIAVSIGTLAPGFPLFSKYQIPDFLKVLVLNSSFFQGLLFQIPGTFIQILVIKTSKFVKTDAGFPLLLWHQIPCIFQVIFR